MRPVDLIGRARTRRSATLIAWATALAAVWVAALGWGGETTEGLSVPGSDSAAAFDTAAESSIGKVVGVSAVLVFRDRDGVFDEQAMTAVDGALIELAAETHIDDPDRPFVDGQVSADRTTAFAEVRYFPSHEVAAADHERLLGVDEKLDGAGVDAWVGGALPDVVADPAPAALEYLGIVIALVVLWRALGSWRLAAWPVLSAAVGVGVTVGLIGLASRVVAVSDSAVQLAALIGLGVGIDGGLLLVTAWHRGGGDASRALSADAAAHAVALAAATVIVSILGLSVVGIPYFTTTAVATALSVATVGVAAFTLLPALTALGGSPRGDPWVGRRSERHAAFLRNVVGRPVVALGAGLAVVVALAAPAPSLTLGQVDAGSAPEGESRRVAHDLLTDEFGAGYASPFTVVLDFEGGLPWERGPIEEATTAAVAELADVDRVLETLWGYEGGEAAFRVVPSVRADSSAGRDVLDALRATVDRTVAGTGAVASVGGDAATRIDVARRVESRLALMVVAVVALSMVLLTAAWRTPVLALKAAALNICSVGAAYGVLVAVFQWGWGASLIGLSETVPIDPVVPVFLFAILFGLSMDYEVFLISAVRDRFDAGVDDRSAIVDGLASSRRIIMVAALVMTAVFAGFITGADPVTKMFGVGLVAAVVVDATVSRGLLVPAALALLGRANTWTPKVLAVRRGDERAGAPDGSGAPGGGR